ncbi:hypothetical protein CKY02_16815 [Photorhabdus bodei]|uniref:Uncharacterized protein n=1 Tax=Photorhabdus bodei TaxID=2029681 RepID=A0A329X1T0_9GAMM|nr:hypothetical protein CKY02_16815 [Photorhabdus bodei]
MLFVGCVSGIDKFLLGMLHVVDVAFEDQVDFAIVEKITQSGVYFSAVDAYTVTTVSTQYICCEEIYINK